jgi:hypothetical protein
MHWLQLNDGRLPLLPLLLRESAELSGTGIIGKLYSIGSCVMIVLLLSQQIMIMIMNNKKKEKNSAPEKIRVLSGMGALLATPRYESFLVSTSYFGRRQ